MSRDDQSLVHPILDAGEGVHQACPTHPPRHPGACEVIYSLTIGGVSAPTVGWDVHGGPETQWDTVGP